MAKYIDADKIRAEIERLKEKLHAEYVLHRHTIKAVVSKLSIDNLDSLLSFIDSLQQEQPDNEDIDKVAQELYEHFYELKRRNNVPTNLYDKQEIIDLWKAGAEWQKAKMLKDNPVIMSVEDFQALIDSHAKRVEADYKEQMLKEAVEGTVMDFSSNRPRPQVDVLLDPHKYHTGDKVRVIIVKEEG